MPTDTVIYPRFLIRTSRACGVVMIAQFVLAILLLGALAAGGRRTMGELTLLLACSLMSFAFGRRALRQLQRLEEARSTPDDLMQALFDLALGVPTIGLLAIAAFGLPS